MGIFQPKGTKLSNISDTDFWRSLRHYGLGRGNLRSLRASHRFPFQAKPSFSKEGLGGLSISMRRIRSRNDKKKKAPKGCLSFLERKTRLEPTQAWAVFSRSIFTPPAPERGDLGSLRASHRFSLITKPSFSKEGLGGLSI